jgi:V-type H+-transporting ATPase subunit a
VNEAGISLQVEKTFFILLFAGDRSRTKIMKICEAFGANLYPFPEEPNKQQQMKAEVCKFFFFFFSASFMTIIVILLIC